MKKYLAILAVGFAFASCKKDYTCKCTYTEKYTKENEVESETYDPVVTIYKGVSKETATEKCHSNTITYKEVEDGVNVMNEDIYECNLTK